MKIGISNSAPTSLTTSKGPSPADAQVVAKVTAAVDSFRRSNADLKALSPDDLKQHIDDQIAKRNKASALIQRHAMAPVAGMERQYAAEDAEAMKDIQDANAELERCKQVAPNLVKGEEEAAKGTLEKAGSAVLGFFGKVGHALGLDKPVKIGPDDNPMFE